MSSKSKFRTLIMIDLETTGLIYDQPKITELAMIAVDIATLEEMKTEEELPRILNKFVRFFDPLKELRNEVVELTGLNNSMLSVYSPFNRETVIAMEAFLNNFQGPFCFVAHNGNLFDFPILLHEIQSALSTPLHSTVTDPSSIDQINTDMNSLSTDDSLEQIINQTFLFSVDCADSLVFFREMHRLLNDKDLVQYPEEKPLPESKPSSIHHGYVEIPIKYIPSKDPARQQPSMKLGKIYEREFADKASKLQAHRAEDDCLMLLAILKRYLPDWIDWIEGHHRKLNDFHSLPLPTTTTTKPPSKVLPNRKPPLRF